MIAIYAYIGCAIAIALLMLMMAPLGRIDMRRFLLNVILWPLLIRGRLL